MKKVSSYIYYSKLIAHFISNNLNDIERTQLLDWKSKSPENLQLFNKILDKENRLAYNNNIQKVDHTLALQKVKRSAYALNYRKNLFRGFMKYAAIFIAIIVSSVTLYFVTVDKKVSFKEIGKEEIIIGSPKAMIILADGSSHELEINNNQDIHEIGGRKITKQNNTISYQDSSIALAKDEIIYNKIITPRGGGDYSVTLSDGSKMYANSLSEIKYPVRFIGDKRVVEILEGEAFFEVTENKEMPFIIKTNGTELKVLGTSFNVSSYKDVRESIITLETGSLQITNISNNKEVILLKPNQQVRINNRNPEEVEIIEVDAQIYSSWRKGRFEFKNERLDFIMETLGRWYNIEVFYEYESLKSLRFGGSLNKNSNINSLLKSIQLTEKVKIETDKNHIIITKNN